MQSSSSGLKSLIYLPVKQSVYWRNSTCENTTRQMHISWCYAVCHSTNSSSVCAPYLQLWEQGDVCPCLWMTIKRPTEDCCQWAGLQRGKERERVCMCVCVCSCDLRQDAILAYSTSCGMTYLFCQDQSPPASWHTHFYISQHHVNTATVTGTAGSQHVTLVKHGNWHKKKREREMTTFQY